MLHNVRYDSRYFGAIIVPDRFDHRRRSTRVIPVPTPVLTPPCEEGIEKIADYPNTGCGELRDALLNQTRNRVDSITSGTAKTLDGIRAMLEPLRWDTGSVHPLTLLSCRNAKRPAIRQKTFDSIAKPVIRCARVESKHRSRATIPPS